MATLLPLGNVVEVDLMIMEDDNKDGQDNNNDDNDDDDDDEHNEKDEGLNKTKQNNDKEITHL